MVLMMDLFLSKSQLISRITSPIIADKGCVCLDIHTLYYVLHKSIKIIRNKKVVYFGGQRYV